MSASTEPERSDLELITRVRGGDGDAYAVLYQRHEAAARRLARSMTRSRSDADDLVQEAFGRVFAALRAGRGPDIAFRPYLCTALRRVAYDKTAGARRETPGDIDLDAVDPGAPFVDLALEEDLDRQMAAQAYMRLPERWQAVLWYTEVEGMAPAAVAPILGVSPNAAAALAYRAREGLRQSYLQVHLAAETDPRCRETVERLGSYTRDGLSRREQVYVDTHLEECERCRALYAELVDVNEGMRRVVAPLVLGVSASAYIAGAGKAGALFGFWRPNASSTTVGAAATVAVVVAAAVGLALTSGSEPPASPGAASSTSVTGAPSGTTGSSAAPPITAPPTTDALPTTDAPSTTTTEAASTTTGPPSPTTSAPASSTTAPTSSSTTTPAAPSTSTPVTGATTTTTVPVLAPRLTVSVSDVGAVVLQRGGIVAVRIDNAVGAGIADGVELEIAASGGVTVDRVVGRTFACTGTAPARCLAASLTPGDGDTLYVHLAASGPGSVAVRATTSTGTTTPAVAGLDVAPTATGVSARFATAGRVQVVQAGNTVMTCPDTDAACAPAKRFIGRDPGNNSFAMRRVDVDADPTTFNSSSAEVRLPSGAIRFAALYWGGDTGAGEGGSRAPAPAARGTVRLTTPDGQVRSVVADRVENVNNRYQGVADVTDLVRANRDGSYTVANVQTGTGVNLFGGWSLVVVAEAPGVALRNVAVFDGLLKVDAATSQEVTLGGFVAPGSVRATLGMVTYEGDPTYRGERLTVNGNVLADATNPDGNYSNSTVVGGGLDGGNRNPHDLNAFGFDVDVFDASRVIAPGARSASVAFGRTSDLHFVGMLVVSVDTE